MQVLRGLADLQSFLATNNCQPGCFADTGFLYGLSYSDDRLFSVACDVHELLADAEVPIYSNVISRLELIDLIFRKQVTAGCIQAFNSVSGAASGTEIFKVLKQIRDADTAAKNSGESFKVTERQLKRVRENINIDYGVNDWKGFCQKYVGTLLNDWMLFEKEMGLNFVEIMEGQISSLFNSPLYWTDMVQVMADHGQRGPDAMIINLFARSKFPLLITGDSDIESCFSSSYSHLQQKAIYVLS